MKEIARTSLDEAALWVGLQMIPGLGSQGICALLSRFGDPLQVFSVAVAELRTVVPEKVALAIAQGPNREAIAPTLAWLQQPHNHLITLADTAYPKSLLEIPDPPPLFYLKGNPDRLAAPALAVVGSRNATPQGEKTAEDFAQALSDAGFCIISGLALGIDAAAHRGALRGKSSTIAVVGTGLDIVYPARHRNLAHDIVERGALLSEYPLGTPSMAQNFPRRNRIISGLSRGCLVVEANLRSGSLITARLAAEQGREVFAIPGSIHSPVAKGCHLLIKQGAKLVDNMQDIVDELGGTLPPTAAPSPHAMDTEHAALLAHMGYDPINIDTLLTRSGLTGPTLSAMLTLLELEGLVAGLPGGRYQRISSL